MRPTQPKFKSYAYMQASKSVARKFTIQKSCFHEKNTTQCLNVFFVCLTEISNVFKSNKEKQQLMGLQLQQAFCPKNKKSEN